MATTGTERLEIDVGDACLEVFRSDPTRSEAPLVIASHPADAFGAGTVELLAKAAAARVVCTNPRGIGGSETVASAVTLEQMVDDLEVVRRRLEVERWTFWGMSGGGWLALLYALRHPRALDGIIVESACACFREQTADPACFLSPFHPSWRPALEKAGLIDESSHARPSSADDAEWITLDGIGEVFRRPNGPALVVSPGPLAPAMRRAMPVLWTFDVRDRLAQVRAPALVLYGTADPIVPVPQARALATGLVGSTLVAIEGAGHVPVTEQRPEAGAAVRSFLAR